MASDSGEDADDEDDWTDIDSEAGSEEWVVTGEASCRYAAAASSKKRKAEGEVCDEAPRTPRRSPRIAALEAKKSEAAIGPSTPKKVKVAKKSVVSTKAAALKQPTTPRKAGILKKSTLELPATPTTPRRSPRLAAKAAFAQSTTPSTPKTSSHNPSPPTAPSKPRNTRKRPAAITKSSASNSANKRAKTSAPLKSPSPAPKLVKKETRFLITIAPPIAPKSPLLKQLAPLSPLLAGRTRAEQRGLDAKTKSTKVQVKAKTKVEVQAIKTKTAPKVVVTRAEVQGVKSVGLMSPMLKALGPLSPMIEGRTRGEQRDIVDGLKGKGRA